VSLLRRQGHRHCRSDRQNVTPHKGDANLFWFGTLQSLCLQCHVTAKAIMEKRGFIGPDGYPIDRGHPVYRAK
jgi:hypothetical protein